MDGNEVVHNDWLGDRQQINRPKAEQWVDKVVSMASNSFLESASMAMSSHFSSVTRVSSCSFLGFVKTLLGVLRMAMP